MATWEGDRDWEQQRAARYAAFASCVRALREAVTVYETSVARSRLRSPANSRTVVSPATLDSSSRAVPPRVVGSATSGPLTARQLEVVRLITRGYTNQRIAEVLVLTPGTVANHIQNILERLQLHSRTQVAVWFAREQAADLPADDTTSLELEARQATGLDHFARNSKQQAIVQARRDELSQRRVRPRLSIEQDA